MSPLPRGMLWARKWLRPVVKRSQVGLMNNKIVMIVIALIRSLHLDRVWSSDPAQDPR